MSAVCCTVRAKFGLVVDKCEEACALIARLGGVCDMEAQDLMARLTLDVVMQAGFGIGSQYLADLQPVPLLQELHYAMDESFRCIFSAQHAALSGSAITQSRDQRSCFRM